MIRITLGIVPAGGGETKYTLRVDLPAVPQELDYISVTRKGEGGPGPEDFIVKRTSAACRSPSGSSRACG